MVDKPEDESLAPWRSPDPRVLTPWVRGRNWSRRQMLGAGLGAAAGLVLMALPHGAQAALSTYDADVGLDPGHSRADVGASGSGVGEYRHTLDVAMRLKPLLEQSGLSVALSRTDDSPLTAMSHPDITERTRIEQTARIAAVGNVRIFVSIHFNGGPPSLHGTETYYNGDNAGPDSRRLGEAIQRHLVDELNGIGFPTLDRGVKDDIVDGKPYGHFFSLRGGMPSVLVEGLFLSNPTEGSLIVRDDTRQAIAFGYAGGIVEYFAASG
jgi:N-acetylmuramoyl-L-alanine amidase